MRTHGSYLVIIESIIGESRQVNAMIRGETSAIAPIIRKAGVVSGRSSVHNA